MSANLQEIPQSENSVHINIAQIPKHTQEVLAAATLDLIHNILAQPGGREAMDSKIAELGLRNMKKKGA